jgi:hypothetical protein
MEQASAVGRRRTELREPRCLLRRRRRCRGCVAASGEPRKHPSDGSGDITERRCRRSLRGPRRHPDRRRRRCMRTAPQRRHPRLLTNLKRDSALAVGQMRTSPAVPCRLSQRTSSETHGGGLVAVAQVAAYARRRSEERSVRHGDQIAIDTTRDLHRPQPPIRRRVGTSGDRHRSRRARPRRRALCRSERIHNTSGRSRRVRDR